MSYLLFPGSASLLRGWSGFLLFLCRSAASRLPIRSVVSCVAAQRFYRRGNLPLCCALCENEESELSGWSANDAQSDSEGHSHSDPRKVPSSILYGRGGAKRSQLICPTCESIICDVFPPNHTSNGFRPLLTVFQKHRQDVVFHWANPSTISNSAKSSPFEKGDG